MRVPGPLWVPAVHPHTEPALPRGEVGQCRAQSHSGSRAGQVTIRVRPLPPVAGGWDAAGHG